MPPERIAAGAGRDDKTALLRLLVGDTAVNTMCPACSGLMPTGPDCPCGEEMLDSGPVTDYMGPYSPYFNTCFESNSCTHLYTCPACGRDARLAVRLKEV